MLSTAANTKDLKRANRNRLYRLIHRYGDITRPELASRLKMSLPTVIQNVKSLLEDGLVHETGSLESTGGRKAATMSVVRDARTSVGIDITRNHLVVAIVDLNGGIVRQERVRVPFAVSAAFIEQLGGFVEKVLADAAVSRESILGAGISFPGILSDDGTKASSHILNTSEYSFGPIFSVLGMPCICVNDANAAGFAETWGSGKENEFVYLSLSNSVGGAVVLNGRPLSGNNKRCGEFGHMTVERGGLRCYCGKKGCLDAYCSAALLSEKTDGDLSLFFKKLDAGDAKFALLWNDYLDYLATAVNSLRMVFDYDLVIGGYVGAYMETYIDDLRERAARLNTFDESGSYIRVCRHKTEASAVGAALMHIEKFIENI